LNCLKNYDPQAEGLPGESSSPKGDRVILKLFHKFMCWIGKHDFYSYAWPTFQESNEERPFRAWVKCHRCPRDFFLFYLSDRVMFLVRQTDGPGENFLNQFNWKTDGQNKRRV
jgi:hypothetical protein